MENNPVLFEDEYVTQQLLSASIVEAAQVCLRAQLAAIIANTRLYMTRLIRGPFAAESPDTLG